MEKQETQQEQVDRYTKKVNEAGIDGPFVPFVALCGVIFRANIKVAREMLADEFGPGWMNEQTILEVAKTMMERIQLVAPVETAGSNVIRPMPPLAFSPDFGGRRNN